MVSGGTVLGLVIAGFVLVGIIGYVVSIYNSLVMLANNIEKAWSNIDVLLKQRHDELPKLIDTAKEYMDYEKDVLQDITEKRTQVQQADGPKETAEANSMLEDALGNLFAVAEDYPDLKANENFQEIQERISALEEQIADRREFYNESVNTYNIRINQIPYNIVASQLGYEDRELFEVEEGDTEDVDIAGQFGT